MMDEALAYLTKMKKDKIKPNLRTFNTILRGCLRNGLSEMAKDIFN